MKIITSEQIKIIIEGGIHKSHPSNEEGIAPLCERVMAIRMAFSSMTHLPTPSLVNFPSEESIPKEVNNSSSASSYASLSASAISFLAAFLVSPPFALPSLKEALCLASFEYF